METPPRKTGNGIKEMAAALAAFPAPGQWTEKEKAQAVQFAALLDAAQKVIGQAALSGINYQNEKETFLASAGKTDSPHTRTAYRAALCRLDAWAAGRGAAVHELSAAQSDDFIYSLKTGGRSNASTRLDAAACSSFFTFLERRHNTVKNPFRGTKARPEKKAAKETIIPTKTEVDVILYHLPPSDALAASLAAFRGLRAGALPELRITGNRFTSRSKGKDIAGELPPEVVKRLGPLQKRPFAGTKANTLEHRIARTIARLAKAGKVGAPYSCHDLRHFYAVTEYRKDRDIYRLKGSVVFYEGLHLVNDVAKGSQTHGH
jgi:integrase